MAKKTETDEPKKAGPAEGDPAPGAASGDGNAAANQGGDTQEKPQDNAKPKPAKKAPGLRIKAKTRSFRRAGLTFGEQPVDVPLSELSKEQRAALKAEPMLVVEDIEITVEA